MKKIVSVLSVATLSLSLLLAGCGGKTNEVAPSKNGQAPAGGTATTTAKVGMVTDVGGVNDNSFNQSAWEGLSKLKTDLKMTDEQVKYLQSTRDDDYVPNLNEFVKNKFDLTWGIGAIMATSIKKVSDDNKDAKLAIIDAEVKAPNVESVLFKEQEGSFLVGVVAASMTKSNKVGFIGGMKLPVIQRFEAGFKAGVKAVKPNAEVITVYASAFDKSDLGKSSASQIYGRGADIIFHAAGATGDGVFNEAKERKAKGENVWVIGVDKDQSITFGDEVTLTSMVKRVDEAVYRVSKDVIDGKFEGGKTTLLGLKEDGVGLPETSKKNVPEDVLKRVEEFKAKIVSGEITVPDKPE